MLGHAGGRRLDAGGPADISDPGHLGDMGDLLGRLDHPQPHGRGGDIDEGDIRKLGLQQRQQVDIDVVEFDPDAPRATDDLANGVEVIVLLPVGIGQVAAMGPPPGLATIDAGTDRGRIVLIDKEAIAPPELAIHEVGIVVDVVIGREQRRIDIVVDHVPTDRVQPAPHLAR